MHKQITSAQNPYIEELVQLKDKSRIRKKTNTFLIEGLREISLAIQGGYQLQTILVVNSIINDEKINNLINTIDSTIEIIDGSLGSISSSSSYKCENSQF